VQSLSLAPPGLFELFYFPLIFFFISLSGTPPFLCAFQRNCFHISLSATLGVQAEGVSKCIFARSASARTGGRLCGESSELSTRDPAPAEPTKRQTGTTARSSAAEEVILSLTHTHTRFLSPPLVLCIEGCSRRGESSSGAAVTKAQTNNRQWREREEGL